MLVTASSGERRGSCAGRPPAFDPTAYKQRDVVKRAFCQLRQHPALATRYDKRDFARCGTIDMASIRIRGSGAPFHDLREMP
jgi:transposase